MLSLPYEIQVGLWLNLDRVHVRSAAAVLQGEAAARSLDPLDYAWFDAMCLLEAEADGLCAEANAARATAKVLGKYGFE